MQHEVTRQIVPVNRRIAVADAHFGNAFPFKVEPTIFQFGGLLSSDYKGGYWDFFTLSNGGFYMAPEVDKSFIVSCPNGFDGNLTADAFGVAVCMYAYSHLSFDDSALAETCADHFHWLREFALGHGEAGAIGRAVD